MKEVGIGVIGAGFMGRNHSTAYMNIPHVFGTDIVPRLEVVADVNEESAKALCELYGFKRWTTDWHEVVTDPNVDVVDITTPDNFHCPIAVEAAKNGKDISCEKPLALNATEAKETTKAIEDAGVITGMGFNYVYNPIQVYVKELIASGELGEVVNFRGTFDQDYNAGEDTPHEWRMLKKVAACGALGNLAPHTISLAQYLVGDITKVNGMTRIVIPERPDPKDPTKKLPVENDDLVQFMCEFDNGAVGAIFANRVACGRKMSITYEIQMTKGCITFTQERQNEVQIYRFEDNPAEWGFKTVLIGPEHGAYKDFFGNYGAIGLGYRDLKTIEMYNMIKNSAEKTKSDVDFRFGCKVNMVIDGVLESARTGQWVDIK